MGSYSLLCMKKSTVEVTLELQLALYKELKRRADAQRRSVSHNYFFRVLQAVL